jgi:hypothetical protein
VLCVREEDGAYAVYKGAVDKKQLPKSLERQGSGQGKTWTHIILSESNKTRLFFRRQATP